MFTSSVNKLDLLPCGVLLFSLLAASGCTPAKGEAKDRSVADSGLAIALVGVGKDDALFPVLQAAGRRIPGVHSSSVSIQAPDHASPGQQADLIRNLGCARLRGLCVQVLEAQPIQQAVQDLASQGVVIVTLGNTLDVQPPPLHSGWDDRDWGAELVATLAAILPGPSTIGVICDDSSVETHRRRQGLFATLPRHGRFEALVVEDCGGDAAAARRIMTAAQAKYPGLDAWITLDDCLLRDSSPGEPAPPGTVWIAAGLSLDFDRRIRGHVCDAMVTPDLDKMVSRAMDMMRVALGGRVPPVRVYEAPFVRVTANGLPAFERAWAAWTNVQPGGDSPVTASGEASAASRAR